MEQLVPHPVALPDGRTIYVLEIPGYDDFTEYFAETLRRTVYRLNVLYMSGVLLSGLICFDKGASWVPETRTWRILQKLCGDIGLRSMVFAQMTYASEARIHDESRRRRIWGPVIDNISHTLLFDGDESSALKIVSNVVNRQKSEVSRPLAIQIEMVHGSRRLDHTAVGQELLETIAEMRAEWEREEQELQAAMRVADAVKEQYAIEISKINGNLRWIVGAQEVLEINNADLIKPTAGSATGHIIPHHTVSASARDDEFLRTYKSNAPTPPIDWALEQGSESALIIMLEQHLTEVAKGPWAWLPHSFELGLDARTVAQTLLKQREETPWIPFEPWTATGRVPQSDAHAEACAHGSVGTETATNRDLDMTDTIASLCGIAGIIPVVGDRSGWNGEVKFENISETDHAIASCSFCTSKDDETSMYDVLLRVINALDGFCSAAAELQSHGWCCDRYTWLKAARWTPPNGHVIELAAMPFARGGLLLQSLRNAQRAHEASKQPLEISTCFTHADMILRDVLDREFADTADDTSHGLVEARLHYCALAVQFLCLSLTAYCQAHVDGLHFFFLECVLDLVVLKGTTQGLRTNFGWEETTISMRLQRLTCLDNMLERPVIVFSAPDTIVQSPEERYDLIATIEDIIDTWGPAGLITSQGVHRPWNHDELVTSGILIRGGIIQKTDDRLWHWSTDAAHHNREVFGVRQMLRIGALVTKNSHCSLDEATCLSIADGFRDPLGSYDPFWYKKQRQFGLSGGQYGSIQYIHVQEKDPGRTLKFNKLENLYTLRNSPFSDQVLPFLEGPWGLQVSFCSGLARRVEMRELFADIFLAWMQRKVPAPELWLTLRYTHHVLEILRQGDLNIWIQELFKNDPKCYKLFCQTIVDISNQLAHTGVDKAGKCFVIAWIPSQRDIDVQCIRVSIAKDNFWASVLRDTLDCATFAYLTLDCLQGQGWGCQSPRGSLPTHLHFVETEVYRHFRDGEMVAESGAAQLRWALEHEHIYAIGRQRTIGWLGLYAHVARPTEADTPRLIVEDTKIPFKYWVRLLGSKVQSGHLRERTTPFDTVQRVVIASKSEE